jgi:hypothetical protein
MIQESKTHHRILFAISATLAAAAAVLAGREHWVLRELKFDDAWIHLRYAANLAAGKGFVYNPGEKVLGSAGVLWELILAVIARATSIHALPVIVTILNCLALYACAAVIIAALRDIVPTWCTLLMAAVLLSYGPLVVSSIGGMETTFLCLLYFVTLYALTRRKWVLASLCAGTSACFRVESMGLMAAAMLAIWLHDRKALGKAVPALFLVPAAIFGWCWWYFGSPVANSTRAKSIVYVLAPGDASRWCVQSMLAVLPFNRVFQFRGLKPETADFIGLFVFAGFALLGCIFLRRKAPAAAFIGLPAVVPFVFYAVANPLMFPWYACTYVPLATLLALLGVFEAARLLGALRAPLADTLAFVLIASLTISPLRSTWPSLSPPDSPGFSFQAPNARESARTYQYARMARWLNARSKDSDRACISEIGAFGYHYRGRVLDGLGLVSPEALHFHPVHPSMRPGGEYGVIPPDVVRTFRPEFVVSLDVFAGALFADSWFLDNYEEIARWSWFGGPARWYDLPATLWGASEIRAYCRRGSTAIPTVPAAER